MSLHNFIGDNNMAANQLRYNNMYQTGNAVTTRAGIGSLGYHAYLSVGNPDAGSYFNRAWSEFIDQMYSAMQQFTSYQSKYSKRQLAGYLHYTAICDWLIAEGTRDLNMLNWDTEWDARAKTDYWGPAADTVISTYLANRPYRITVAQNLIASYARQYPHVVTPWQKTIEYLISNIFTDDDSSRTNFIYMHLFNDTMQASLPNPYRCFDLLESISDITAQNWTIGGTTFANPFYAFFEQGDTNRDPLGNIRADLAKIYAADLTYPHYEFLESGVMETPVYDSALAHALNQGQYGTTSLMFQMGWNRSDLLTSSPAFVNSPDPQFIRPVFTTDASTVPNMIAAGWAAHSTLHNAIFFPDQLAPSVMSFANYHMAVSPSGATSGALDALNHAVDYAVDSILVSGSYSFPYYGPSFEGEPVLEGMIFDQATGSAIVKNLNAGDYTTTVRDIIFAHCSEYGITLANLWNNTINTTGASAINYMYGRIIGAGANIAPGPARFVLPGYFRSGGGYLNAENSRSVALNTDAFSVWSYQCSYCTDIFTNPPSRISLVSVEDVDEFTLISMADEPVIASTVIRGIFGTSINVPAARRSTTLAEKSGLGYQVESHNSGASESGYGGDDASTSNKKWKNHRRNGKGK